MLLATQKQEFAERGIIRLPGLQFFALVNEIRPGGGGTVALAGSHKLVLPEMGDRVAVRKNLASC